MLRNPGREITVSHRTEALQHDQAEEQGDQFGHPSSVVLYSNNVPQRSGEPQQGEIYRRDPHHQHSGEQHAGKIGFQEWKEALKGRHDATGS